MVCQIKGFDGIIECRGAKVGSTRGVSQGVRVNSGLRSIIVHVGSKGSLLGILATSMSLFAAMASVSFLSLGRSTSVHTTVEPTLLLLGKLGVSWLLMTRSCQCKSSMNFAHAGAQLGSSLSSTASS